MLTDGDWVTGVAGDSGIISGTRVATGSSGRGGGIRGSGSLLGSPRDVAMGVAAASFWFAPVGPNPPVVNMGGGGRPAQPLSRNARTSWELALAQ